MKRSTLKVTSRGPEATRRGAEFGRTQLLTEAQCSSEARRAEAICLCAGSTMQRWAEAAARRPRMARTRMAIDNEPLIGV